VLADMLRVTTIMKRLTNPGVSSDFLMERRSRRTSLVIQCLRLALHVLDAL
jgi:hypothetical protein